MKGTLPGVPAHLCATDDAKTAAVSGYYAGRGLLRQVNAARSLAEVAEELDRLIARP